MVAWLKAIVTMQRKTLHAATGPLTCIGQRPFKTCAAWHWNFNFLVKDNWHNKNQSHWSCASNQSWRDILLL